MSRAAPSLPRMIHQVALRATIVLAIIVFGPVWYYQATETGFFPFPGLSPVRNLMWLTGALVIGAHLLRFGPDRLIGVLAPFLPFLLWGAIGLSWSVELATSIRTLVFWAIGGGAIAAVALELPPETGIRWACGTLLAAVALSFALAALAPANAFTEYDGEPTLRGLFPHKNVFGWTCGLGLVWSWTQRAYLGRFLGPISSLVFISGLLVSNSKTAAVVAILMLGYLFLISLLPRIFGDGSRSFLLLLFFLFLVISIGSFGLPYVLGLMGRDMSLTGRGDVWQHYLGYILQQPLTGFGTGIFSTETGLNARIGGTIPGAEGQGLHSPHNSYIGILGETGLLGLCFFILCHLYLALIAPFRRLDRWTRLAAALSLGILVGAVSEVRDAYVIGVATLLLIMCRAMAIRTAATSAAAPPRGLLAGEGLR